MTLSPQRRRKLILILGSIAAIGPLSIDMYLPGFSAIAADLNTTVSRVSLSLTTYFVGISIGQIIYGPLLDRFGRKPPLLIGFTLYFLAAIGCALATDIVSFILLRFLLALGGCVGMVASRAIIRDHFENDEIARAFSSLILVMGAAPIIAPTIGGQLVAGPGWRSIFWFLTAYSFALVLLVRFALPESRGRQNSVSLKPREIARNYWSVMRNRTFLIYGTAGTIGLASMFTYIAGSPLVIMEILGFDETSYGWLFGLNALGFISGSQINKQWLRKRHSEQVSLIMSGLTLLSALLLLISLLMGIPSVWFFLACLFLFTSSLGFVNPNLQAIALGPFRENAGVASALVGSIRMTGGAIASALVGILANGTAYPMVLLMLGCALSVSGILLYQRHPLSGKTILNPQT